MSKHTGYTRVAAARAELDTVLASSRDAIIEITAAGVIGSCNPAAARLYGYPAQELIGQPAEILTPADQRPAEAEVLHRVLSGEQVESYRTDRSCRDGSTVAVSTTIAAIADRGGAVIVSYRVGEPQQGTAPQHQTPAGPGPTDADRAQTEAQSHADKDALDAHLQQGQRLEILGQLAGGVAHDFNNLLAVILNYAAFVGEELAAGARCDWDAAGRDVAQIRRAAERAAALTHQLLAFARREVVQPRVLDLNHVVTDVQLLLERSIGEDVMLRTDLATDLWPVLADAGRIEQVLLNLAVNARDAMSGGGTLSIDTANITVDADFIATDSPVPAGRHVRLRIGDTGAGMTPEVLAHVFEPFFTTKPEGSGTGLGLATVYGIVAQADATIDVHSQPGTGTTFTIMIPVTDEEATADVQPPSYERTPTGEMVLIVEDEEALREVTERIFTRSGYQVMTAANGTEAVHLATGYDDEIHLLVTDVVMPNMLGTEVADKIRQIKPDIEVLFMSGYAQPVLTSRGRLEPDVNLIEKPFTATSLIERAGQILNGHFSGYHTAETDHSTTPAETDRAEHP